ncbi:MAG: 4-hydroxybenzoate octaprenyltransferase [Phycisphaerales bacterium]
MTQVSAEQTPAIHASPAQSPLRLIARDIKLAHSVFALPFAVVGAFLAGPFPAPSWGTARGFLGKLVLVVVCMVAARTWAMVINRLADRDFDRQNQRTRRRVFASGELQVVQGTKTLAGCAVLFVGVCSLFWVFYGNYWPLALSVPVLAWLAFYSFTKRFTALCHLVLGASLAASPLAAALAVDPHSLGRTPALFWIAGFVLCWVAGFDIIYALQDRDFDRGLSLRSIPAALGFHGAAWVSRILHLGAGVCIVFAWRAEARFSSLLLVGIGVVLALLVWEHVLLAGLIRRSQEELAKEPPALNMAFFTLNGMASVVVGICAVVDMTVSAY